ncbi:MAG: hypothetical protein HQK60_00990 [Deltaproteobacteria bacterium]|nr:hypothetical protein [Deltaproteobacteria bacterium]
MALSKQVKNMAKDMQNRRNHYFKDGKPQHELSYCAFLDVLGFSDRIKDSFSGKNPNALLEKFHKILSDRIEALNAHTSFLYFKAFTDNVILACPQFTEDLESEFGFILGSISEYQYIMALEGFFIRGGLSIGPLFMDENCVYGPALLSAYELESKHAVHPIVVLSNDVKDLVLSHVNYYAIKKEAPQNRDAWVNSDGRFFLNYLSECIIDSGDDEFVDWDSLSMHARNIEKCLKQHYGNSTVFSKYAWLANYHNQFCETVSDFDGFTSSVEISAQEYSIKLRKISELDL